MYNNDKLASDTDRDEPLVFISLYGADNYSCVQI